MPAWRLVRCRTRSRNLEACSRVPRGRIMIVAIANCSQRNLAEFGKEACGSLSASCHLVLSAFPSMVEEFRVTIASLPLPAVISAAKYLNSKPETLCEAKIPAHLSVRVSPHTRESQGCACRSRRLAKLHVSLFEMGSYPVMGIMAASL